MLFNLANIYKQEQTQKPNKTPSTNPIRVQKDKAKAQRKSSIKLIKQRS